MGKGGGEVNWMLCRALAMVVGFAGEPSRWAGPGGCIARLWPLEPSYPRRRSCSGPCSLKSRAWGTGCRNPHGPDLAAYFPGAHRGIAGCASTAGAGLPGSWWRALCAGALVASAQPPGCCRGGRHSAVGEPGCRTKGRRHDCGPGREERLTEEGVIKATVETVAENLSDGVIAPAGICRPTAGRRRGCFYKTVNTMDSMVGYRNDRYRYFGTGAARLDDVCNFLPARLTALLMILLSGVCGLDRRGAWRVFAPGPVLPCQPQLRPDGVCHGWGSGDPAGETPGILANCTKRRPSATACGRWNLPTFPVRSC